MELRLLEILLRLLDPRKFRTRMKQLGAASAFGIFVWVRAVLLRNSAAQMRELSRRRRRRAVDATLAAQDPPPPPRTMAEALERQ